MLSQDELDKLTTYLNGVFSTDDLMLLQHPENAEAAAVIKAQTLFATVERDEDEGELSYNFVKTIADEPDDELKASVQEIFNSKAVEVRKRANKTDSSEIYKGEEFLGVLYDDDENEEGNLMFNMAILDIDLEDETVDV